MHSGKEVSKEWTEMESQKFFRWCYSRFTKPEDGLARLVVVPEEERKTLTKTLSGARYVATHSFRSPRENNNQEN